MLKGDKHRIYLRVESAVSVNKILKKFNTF